MDTLKIDISVPVRSFDVDVAVEVPAGVFALAGPSGAGKSTVLRTVAGLLRPRSGRIALGSTAWFDRDAGTNLEPQDRSVGLVFQDYALFPHLTVAQNVAFGANGSVEELLERFRIGHLARERPGLLSGGERQRVALARALARRPSVLLLDEPLAALDARTRESVRFELAELLRGLSLPTILVSHDFEDAAALAEQVGILVGGQIVQVGSPVELVRDPQSAFVASFTGSNLLYGHARAGASGKSNVVLEGGARVDVDGTAEGPIGVVIHPWDVTVTPPGQVEPSANGIEVIVSSVVPRGDRLRISTSLLSVEVEARAAVGLDLTPGSRIAISFASEAARLVPVAAE